MILSCPPGFTWPWWLTYVTYSVLYVTYVSTYPSTTDRRTERSNSGYGKLFSKVMGLIA